mgnify:CR=1 FL=1
MANGNAEGLVGFSRRNFMVPIPRFVTWEAFNDHLKAQCRKRQGDVLRGQGKYLSDRLTARDWEFIDIRMPRFLVKAIWPDYVPEVVSPSAGADAMPYTTPYLDLMRAAIARFGITPEAQGKKECLVDWFLEQQIEGEPVSNKLADAMATLIRLPSAQRGGAKRVLGPDLRQTG